MLIMQIHAILCRNNQGPHFGNFYCVGTNNWKFYDSGSVEINTSYHKIGIPEKFTVENYEVFQVIKK
jgi:hypothetical protein